MKNASLVSVGNEILSGLTVDTNAAYLSRELLSMGIPVVSGYTVPDEVEAVSQAIRRAKSDANIVLVTGGLGPTDDDLTRQALASYLHVELEFHQELLYDIDKFFRKRNRPMTERNRVQAYLPAGTHALSNPVGTAPGMLAETDGGIIVAMPGVPSEMKLMFRESVGPRLKKADRGQVVLVHKLRCFGTGESNVAQMLGDFMQRGRNPLINCTVSGSVITLHIVATAGEFTVAGQMIDRDTEALHAILGDLVFGHGEQTLADVVAEKLTAAGKTLAVAESCTGGLLAKMLTDPAGASAYFHQGWITYTNDSKTVELGVPRELIARHGAVSEQVARAMAEGARRRAATDFAIGITGIAGPTGATEHKPLGSVYISVDSACGCLNTHGVFSHGRGAVRLRAALTAMNMLRRELDA